MMHHGFVDKMWSDWQGRNATRLQDVSGPNAQDPAIGFIEFPNMGGIEGQSKMWGKPTDEMKAVTPSPQDGDGGPETTLNHVLGSVGIIPNTTIAEIMDIQGGYLCYEYV
jgi:tyrosinase